MLGLFDCHDKGENIVSHGGLFGIKSQSEHEKRERQKEDHFWDELNDLDTLGFFDDEDKS